MRPSDRSKEILTFLVVLNLAVAFGFQGWRTLFNNFAVEAAGIDGLRMGTIQSLREVPGFLALLVAYILFIVREQKLAALSTLAMGLGVALTGLFPSFAGLMLTTLLMSFGFHYFETVNMSLALQHFDTATAPVVAGRLRGLQSGANLAVGGIILVAGEYLGFASMFGGIGLAVCLAALWCLAKSPKAEAPVAQHKGMLLRKRYRLFYGLTFLAGARRQIFVAFAVFLMVQRLGFTVREITLLFVANNVANWFAAPLLGKAIARFGERKILSLEYFSLIFVFLGYALVQDKLAASCLYVLDHLFFNFALAIRTYFQKVGDPAHIAPSMAVGFTINHIAAVAIPVAGGALWMLDYRIPFIAGAALSLCSLILAQFIKTPRVSQGG